MGQAPGHRRARRRRAADVRARDGARPRAAARAQRARARRARAARREGELAALTYHRPPARPHTIRAFHLSWRSSRGQSYKLSISLLR